MTQANQDPATSAQGYLDDPRNENVVVYVNGEFVPRDDASVSVFDAGFVLGDGVWEGLRLVRGKLLASRRPSRPPVRGRRCDPASTSDARATSSRPRSTKRSRAMRMTDGAHVRLMVTRGRKKTPNQDPRFVVAGPTIVIVAEFKSPESGHEGARACAVDVDVSLQCARTSSTCASIRTAASISSRRCCRRSTPAPTRR